MCAGNADAVVFIVVLVERSQHMFKQAPVSMFTERNVAKVELLIVLFYIIKATIPASLPCTLDFTFHFCIKRKGSGKLRGGFDATKFENEK